MKILNLLLIALLASPVFAEDSGGSGDSDYDNRSKLNISAEMKEARTLIYEAKYRAAVRKLNGVIRQEYRNADAWNLIGFSNRKMGKYKKAGRAYKKALKYNPEHKGALEYQGELFIETQRFDKAHENRSKLAALCPDGCEELDELDLALNGIN
jgi:tetratricopeptide (TPR) repeat protein